MPTADFGFPKAARLRRRSQYLAVQSRPGRIKGRHFLVLWRPNGLRRSRLGVTVTRRVSGAVGRNRTKRLVREAFRHAGDRLPPGLDLVVVATAGAPRLSSRQVNQELWDLWSRLRTPQAGA
jgi:ribonuclease P protein component